MTHDPMCWYYDPDKIAGAAVNDGWPCICDLIARVREDEGNRHDGMAVVHWDAGYAHGLSKGLWIGWAIGTLMMLIPIIVFVVTQ